MKKFFKSNIKLLIGIMVGAVLSGFTVYSATILFDGDQVGFDNSLTNLKKVGTNNNVDNVQDAIDAIYSKVPTHCTSSPFQLGDYIDMTPTSQSFSPSSSLTGIDEFNTTWEENETISGTINPSELSVWRVININSDCTVEIISEYVSTTPVKFASKIGYMNFIYYLNLIARQYANTQYTLDPSTASAGAFRNIGYDPNSQTAQITNRSKLDDTSLGNLGGAWNNKITPLNNQESLGGGDEAYVKDLNMLKEAGISMSAFMAGTSTITDYWLASRLYDWRNDSKWYFRVRAISYNNVSSYYLVDSGTLYNCDTREKAVRPIVTLKSNVTHSSGNGTSASHYTLSVN